MDDHFWPSLYPGIGIGLLIGIAYGGWRNAILGSLGGLAGALPGYFAGAALGVEEEIAAFLLLVTAAALGAYAAVATHRWLSTARVGSK